MTDRQQVEKSDAGSDPPAGSGPASDVVLSDGSVVRLRSIRSSDRAAVVAMHETLSEESVYFRYFAVRRHLSESEIERIVDVDGVQRLTLSAWRGENLVGLASYYATDRSEAEVGFCVADEYQGRGLGTLLLEHLAEAAFERGFRRFIADTLVGNKSMLHVFYDAGFRTTSHMDGSVVRVVLDIRPSRRSDDAAFSRTWSAEARSIRNILAPASIAVVGAGRKPGGAGHALLRNILDGGYTGRLSVVHPSASVVCGVTAYPKLVDIPERVDLAVVAVPAASLPDVIEDCGRKNVSALLVVTAGFAESGAAGAIAEAEIVDLARRNGMRIVGPNCLGIINTDPKIRLNATFAASSVTPGRIGFVSQSGALGIAFLDLAGSTGLGISSFASVGNKADVSSNDFLEYWRDDARTRLILLYLESFGNPRKFSRIARDVSRRKPIVAVKSGRSTAGARAAASHTAALASPDAVVDGVFTQCGVIRVDTFEEMLDVARVLVSQPLPHGRRIAILGNSGGPGILAADACAAHGLLVEKLGAATARRLRREVPGAASWENPIDLAAAASESAYERALDAVLGDPGVDAVIVIHTRTAIASAPKIAEAIARCAAKWPKKTLVANFVGFTTPPQELESVAEAPEAFVPSFAFPERACAALAQAVEYAEWRRLPVDRWPRPAGISRTRARRLVEERLAASPAGEWLGPEQSSELLDCYGIRAAEFRVAKTVDEAFECAAEFQGPVALKVISNSILHKTDAGGVELDLETPDATATAFAEMRERLGGAMQAAIVQPMASPGEEVIVGIVQDPSFGPIVAFGMGGVDAELLGDVAIRAAPLTAADAAGLIRGLRCSARLFGHRGSEPCDEAALTDLLLRVGRLADDLPEVAELDLNPVIASSSGVAVVDVRIRITPPGRALGRAPRLAAKPFTIGGRAAAASSSNPG